MMFLLAPSIKPTFKNFTAFNSTAVVVKWFPINDTHEVVIGYVIMWQRKGHKQHGMEDILGANTSSFALTGLRKYTNYTIKIAAYNSIGMGPYSEMIMVQTDVDGKEDSNEQCTVFT